MPYEKAKMKRPATGKRKGFVIPGELEAAQKEEARDGEGKTMSRRKFLKVAGAAALGLGAAAALGGLAMTGRQDDEVPGEDTFVYAPSECGEWHSNLEGRPVNPEHFEPGRTASAVWRDRPATLMHTGDLGLKGPAEVEDYMFMDIIAFYTVCPHLGCTVGANRGLTGPARLFCVCHDSYFEPLEIVEDRDGSTKYLGAKHGDGPADRALPLIPVILRDGSLAGDGRHWPQWYDY